MAGVTEIVRGMSVRPFESWQPQVEVWQVQELELHVVPATSLPFPQNTISDRFRDGRSGTRRPIGCEACVG